jgi:hypothetical protein
MKAEMINDQRPIHFWKTPMIAAGVRIALVTGWLGGELVDRLGRGVEDGANLDAPSSLSGPARR